MKKEEIILEKPLFGINIALRYIMEKLSEIGCRSLIVGGAVRDAILHIQPKDLDIEVYSISYVDLEAFLSRLGKVDLVGKSFGIVKFKPAGQDETYDFSIPRRENRVGVGHKEFQVTCDPSMTIRDAALRRDLTINSISYDPIEHKIYDYFGGMDDLKNKIIRHTSPAFREDPLRILRAMGFQARFDFTIHPDTIQAMKEIVASGDFESLPKERIFEEWMKFAEKGVRHDLIFQFLRDTNLINYYPELKALQETPQDHVYHPEGCVETHTILCLCEMDRIIEREKIEGIDKVILILSILFHDVAKPCCTKNEMKKGRMTITSNGHEAMGGEMVKDILLHMGFHEEIITPISNLIANHLAGISIDTIIAERGKLKAVKRLSRRLAPATINQLLYIMEADTNGRGSTDRKEPPGSSDLRRLAMEINVENKPYQYLLMGRHLIEVGLKPSTEFGEILRKSYIAQEEGEFYDIESAKQWLQNFLVKI